VKLDRGLKPEVRAAAGDEHDTPGEGFGREDLAAGWHGGGP
jgi:hypothetical protein